MVNKANDWLEIGSSGQSNSNVWDYKTDKELIGLYTGMRQHIGPNDQNMYDFETEQGVVSVWGTAFINNKFADIPVGHEVKMIYEGKVKNPKTGREFNAFRIYHREVKE